MRKRLSVSRLMVGIALLAVGLATLLPLRPRPLFDDPGVTALAATLALVLTAGAGRALFGRRHRAFWLGFTVAGWLCAAGALIQLREVRGVLLRHGPPIVRAREDHIRARVAALRMQSAGVAVAMPEVPEADLFVSMLVETGLGLGLGSLVAGAGGLYAAAVALIARWLAQAITPSRPDAVADSPCRESLESLNHS